MSFRNPAQWPNIASGDTLSDTIDLRGMRDAGIVLPNSMGQSFLQVSFDTTSANFRRAQNPLGSGQDWTIGSLGATGAAVAIADIIGPFPYARLEQGAAVTDTRTIVVTGKVL